MTPVGTSTLFLWLGICFISLKLWGMKGLDIGGWLKPKFCRKCLLAITFFDSSIRTPKTEPETVEVGQRVTFLRGLRLASLKLLKGGFRKFKNILKNWERRDVRKSFILPTKSMGFGFPGIGIFWWLLLWFFHLWRIRAAWNFGSIFRATAFWKSSFLQTASAPILFRPAFKFFFYKALAQNFQVPLKNEKLILIYVN